MMLSIASNCSIKSTFNIYLTRIFRKKACESWQKGKDTGTLHLFLFQQCYPSESILSSASGFIWTSLNIFTITINYLLFPQQFSGVEIIVYFSKKEYFGHIIIFVRRDPNDPFQTPFSI